MAITDLIFIFTFLPISLGLYYIAKANCRKYILLFVSLLFYASGAPEYFFLLLISLSVNILIGWLIDKFRNIKKISLCWLILGITYNLAVLFYYKYIDFFLITVGRITHSEMELKSLLLPLGLSFFAFKAISYLLDVFSGKIDAKRNPIYAALYLSLFTQVQSGPISRFSDMQFAINDSQIRGLDFDGFSEGIFRFVIGFNKKVLIADILSNITMETFAATQENMSIAYAWLGAFCYSLQLFFDFSGYSDMAIGLSRMLGYTCPENFNYPYMTKSVSDFWRRWHITLGAWFRDYVYIPLGGSRVGKVRLYLNLLIVWLLTGIWHGASWNFVFWGLSYFVLIAWEKATGWPDRFKSKVVKGIYRVYTLFAINFLWVIFGANGLKNGIRYLKTMIHCQANHLADARARFLVKDNFVFILMAIVLCFPVVPWLADIFGRRRVTRVIWNVLLVGVNAFLFIWALSYVAAGQNNPFAYANF